MLFFKTVKIVDLLNVNNNTVVTIVGLVYGIEPTRTFACKDGKTRSRQNVQVVDDSLRIVTITLWEPLIDKLIDHEGSCVLFHQLETRDYAGKRTLTSTHATLVDPSNEVAQEAKEQLMAWWLADGADQDFNELELPVVSQ